jgi:hypothetical protein
MSSKLPPKGTSFEQEMVQLDAEIRRLEAEYNMFFAGRLPRLPWETRARVDALVKRYDRMNIRNTAERFRFETLQNKYSGFCELWERALRAKEEGRPIPGRRSSGGSGGSQAATPAEKKRDGTESENVLHVARFKDPLQEREALNELYERLAEARKESGEQQIPFHRFAEVVKAQMTKLGGNQVQFRVAKKDGKVTLTAEKDGE